MEQESGEKKIEPNSYRVFWHQEIKEDFKRLPPSLVEDIIKGAEHKLSLGPKYLGSPLRGSSCLIWRAKISDYRILYTLEEQPREVWILSVQHRSIVYKSKHIKHVLELAMVLRNRARS